MRCRFYTDLVHAASSRMIAITVLSTNHFTLHSKYTPDIYITTDSAPSIIIHREGELIQLNTTVDTSPNRLPLYQVVITHSKHASSHGYCQQVTRETIHYWYNFRLSANRTLHLAFSRMALAIQLLPNGCSGQGVWQ